MDLLAAEQLIIDRLTAQVRDVKVTGMADLQSGAAARQITPRLDVIYAGHQVLEQKGCSVRLQLRYLVVVAVRSARDTAGGSGARREAGPLLGAALAALAGWKPDASHGALRAVTPFAPIFEAGFGYFPLLFTTTRSIQGANP